MSAITLKYVVKLQLIHFYLHALHYLFQMEGIIKPVEDVLKVEDGTTMKETIRVKVVDVVPVYNYKQGGESKSHPLRGEGENMPLNNGGTNI